MKRTFPNRLLLAPKSSYSAPKQVEAELQGVAASEPAQVILKLLGVGAVAFLPPRILSQTRHSVAEGHVQNAVDVRQVRRQAHQPEILHHLQTVLRGAQAQVVVDRIVVQAESPAKFVQQVGTERVGVGNRGGAVVALLPALPDGRQVAFPDAVVSRDQV